MSASTEPDHHAIHWLRGGPVPSYGPRSRVLGLEGEATSAIADPTILGLWSFATGTWMVGVVGGGYLPAADLTSLAPTALFITGIAQFIAGLYSFHRDNMFPATAFTCFGAYHVVNGLMFLLHFAGVLNAHNGMNLMSGYFDQSFAFIAFGLLLAIAPFNVLLIIITATTALGSCLIGIAEFHGGATHALGIAYAGGALLFLDAGAAYYLGMAIIVNATFGRELLPVLGEV